jgi:general nucleoside transport system permease protein
MRSAIGPLRAVALSLLTGAIIILLMGENPALAFRAVAQGAFGSWHAVGRTLQDTTPLLLTGLAVAVAFRAGLFNIGVEGQMVLGALAAAIAASRLGLPPFLALLAAVTSGVTVGALFAALAGVLRARFRVHEVLSTIMLNFIAFALASWVLARPGIKEPGSIPQTPAIPEGAGLPDILPEIGLGIVVAVLAAVALHAFLSRTRPGFEMRTVGLRPEAARAGGVHVGRTMILAMVFSGALAGMAGVDQVLGVHGRYIEGFSPGYGFTGIAIAFLAMNRPLAVIPAALLFGALKAGALSMDALTPMPREIITMLQALVLVFVAAETWGEKRRRRARRVLVEGGA